MKEKWRKYLTFAAPSSKKPPVSKQRLAVTYYAMLATGVVITATIIWLQIGYKPEPYYGTQPQSEILEPVRGTIYDCNGKVLAISVPEYEVRFDPETPVDTLLNNNIDALSKALSGFFKDKSTAQYKKLILEAKSKGNRFLKLGNRNISHEEMLEVKKFPVFRFGQRFGGIIFTKYDKRQYPYGRLARRVLGYIQDRGEESGVSEIGLEGSFNQELSGESGIRYLRTTEGRNTIPDVTREAIEPIDGADIHTTLDINIQAFAEQALRRQIDTMHQIQGGCVVVMEVATGAIRAMVNLKRDDKGNLDEIFNYVLRQKGEPGSVFKASALMTLLDDNKTTLSTVLNTNYGEFTYKGKVLPRDPYVKNQEKITVLEGFQKSSNQVMRTLVCDNYTGNESYYVDKLLSYKLAENFQFDIGGEIPAVIPYPGDANWWATTLPQISIGYNVELLPIHTVTFYNGIANNGKVMRPYLVESLNRKGKELGDFGPKVLNGKMCRQQTIDSLKYALRRVVTHGTGREVSKAKCPVGGKTGTARVCVTYRNSKGMLIGGYQYPNGSIEYQASFVGFFPVDKPKYTVSVIVYSKPSYKPLYGGTWCGPVFTEIVNRLYSYTPHWGQSISAQKDLSEYETPEVASEYTDGIMPDLTGMGLSQALYLLESNGLKVSYSGRGRVTGQFPLPGEVLPEDKAVKIKLN